MKNIFKKSDTILKYSEVKLGMKKKQQSKYVKSNNTLILDEAAYYTENKVDYLHLKTLIIDENILKLYISVKISDCTAKNIYINNYKNLGGITIPYELFINHNAKLELLWKKIDEIIINVIVNNEIISLTSQLTENITISKFKDSLKIIIENYNSIISYKIDSLGETEIEYRAREIHEEDIKDNILDLRRYEKYNNIYFDVLEFDKLMINKYVIKNINKYNYMFHNLEFNKLEIIDDNDMKLFQRNTLLDINKNTKLEKSKNKLIGNMIKINNENDYKFIYIDKSDNIIVLDKEYLIKKYDCMDAKIIIEEYARYCNFLFLLKDKDDNYKVVIDDKIYELTDTFKQFLLLNEDLYLLGDKIKELKNNKWFNILGINSLNVNSFINTYKDYIKYKNRLEIFKKMGLTDDAINYLCQRKIHTIINTETEDGLIDIDNLNKFEIDGFNEIGEKYKKILKK